MKNLGKLYLNNQLIAGEIMIPGSVEHIGDNAFVYNSDLTSVIISEGVKSIGSYSFYRCSNLSNITFPNSLNKITDISLHDTPWYNNQPDGVVYAGKVLYHYKGTMPDNTSIVVKDGTLGIAARAFDCEYHLTNITIPDSVNYIGFAAFSTSGSSVNYLTINILSTTPPELGSDVFGYGNEVSVKQIIVPKGTLNAYQTATNWSTFADKMVEATE